MFGLVEDLSNYLVDLLYNILGIKAVMSFSIYCKEIHFVTFITLNIYIQHQHIHSTICTNFPEHKQEVYSIPLYSERFQFITLCNRRIAVMLITKLFHPLLAFLTHQPRNNGDCRPVPVQDIKDAAFASKSIYKVSLRKGQVVPGKYNISASHLSREHKVQVTVLVRL